MKIRSIRASNFLSFGPGDAGLNLEGLHDLTILVGPNGAGKTNVLRALQILSTFLGASRSSPLRGPLADYANRVSGGDSPLHLEVDVEFDRDQERKVIHAFWLNSMAYPEQSTLELSIDTNGQERAVQPTVERLRQFAAWVEDHSRTVDVRGLFKGRFVLDVDVRRRYPDASVSYECQTGGQPLVIGMDGRQMVQGGLTFPEHTGPVRHTSAIAVMLAGLRRSQRDQLARFLAGQPATLPPIPRLTLERLEMAARNVSGWFRLEPPSQYAHVGLDRAPALRMTLNTLLDRHPDDTERLHFGAVFAHLVRDALIWCLDWDVHSEQSLTEDVGQSVETLLGQRDLAIYLLRLKNGDEESRRQFHSIQNDFKNLTGAGIDVRLDAVPSKTTSPPGQGQPAEQTAMLVTDHNIPLSFAGSGREQLVALVMLMQKHPGGVILLDEPEQHVNPVLQRVLARRIPRSQGQALIVTHSPYMIPPGQLVSVRRLVSTASSQTRASRLVDPSTARDLALGKRPAYPEDSGFLFSWCTVFVEGPNDAAALPVWFEEWARTKRLGQTAAERLGIRFQFVGGAKAILPWLRIANQFLVPALGLYDADVLSNKPNKRDMSRDILTQWKDLGVVPPDVEVPLGDPQSLVAVHELDSRIFFCGASTDDSLEGLPECHDHHDEAVRETGGDPLAYRYIAERYPCPDILYPVFESAYHVAATAQGVRGT